MTSGRKYVLTLVAEFAGVAACARDGEAWGAEEELCGCVHVVLLGAGTHGLFACAAGGYHWIGMSRLFEVDIEWLLSLGFSFST